VNGGRIGAASRVLAHGKARRLEREAQPHLLSTTAKTERNNEIVRLSRGGMSARKIAERFAISPCRVIAIIHKYG
jgi:DNA-binding NarL/FixJ family response regulator